MNLARKVLKAVDDHSEEDVSEVSINQFETFGSVMNTLLGDRFCDVVKSYFIKLSTYGVGLNIYYVNT
jgi:hypothetical protein